MFKGSDTSKVRHFDVFDPIGILYDVTSRYAAKVGLVLFGASISEMARGSRVVSAVLIGLAVALFLLDGYFEKFDPQKPLPAPRRPVRKPATLDGSFMQVRGRAPLYLIQGGARFHVLTPRDQERITAALKPPTILCDDWREVQRIPLIPREGVTLQEHGMGDQWFIHDKRRFRTNHNDLEPAVVPRGGLSQVPVGDSGRS